jgi:glucokinase
MPPTRYYVGVDVGGTSIKSGVVDDAGSPLSVVMLPTEAARGQEHGLAQIAEAIRQAVLVANLRLDHIAAIGVATPGPLDIGAGIVLEPPNLKPWRNVPVRRHIEEAFGLPTAFQNDANAAAYGEFWCGAGRDAQSIVMFTLGTGIGCGIVLDGTILEGRHSHAGEVGHVRVELTNPRRCACGRLGCLEAYASATAIVVRTLEALAAQPGKSILAVEEKAGSELSARQVFEAAAAGDRTAQKIVSDTAFYLAVATANMMHTIDPDMIIFGGGMIAAGRPFLDQIRCHVGELAFPVPAMHTAVCYAQLGSNAGFIGAAGCARKLAQERDSRITP